MDAYQAVVEALSVGVGDAAVEGGMLLGISLFAFMSGLVALRSSAARDELRKVNSELRATQALLAHQAMMDVIGQNIANANTPGYRAKSLDPRSFQTALRKALGTKTNHVVARAAEIALAEQHAEVFAAAGLTVEQGGPDTLVVREVPALTAGDDAAAMLRDLLSDLAEHGTTRPQVWSVKDGLLICQGYGLTETAPIVSANPLEDNVPASVGVPIRGVKVRIGDNDRRMKRSPGPATISYGSNGESSLIATAI